MKLERNHMIKNIPYQGFWYGENCYIVNGTLTICEGFEWDGMTLVRDGKRNGRGLPYTWVASCLHDALYRETLCPLSRKQVDRLFLRELEQADFKYANLYYRGVRLISWLFWRS